jgi:hypothetical protein
MTSKNKKFSSCGKTTSYLFLVFRFKDAPFDCERMRGVVNHFLQLELST